MSTVIANKRVSRFQIYNIIFAMMLSYVFGMLILKQEDTYQEQVIAELKYVEIHADADVWSVIDYRARNRHQEYLYSSGAFALIKRWFLPKENDSSVNNTFSGEWNYRAVNNIQVLFFQVMQRISAMEHWGGALVLLCVAIIGSGYNKWRAGKYRLGGASVNRVRLWLKLLWLSGAMIFTFVVTPNIFGEYTYYAPAIFIVIFAIAVAKLIQSFNKSF